MVKGQSKEPFSGFHVELRVDPQRNKLKNHYLVSYDTFSSYVPVDFVFSTMEPDKQIAYFLVFMYNE